ncbi:STAS domain-containing protein [Amycolatopsis sp. K13G38]|uniref:STAS domain-containing protein n=1 Tax=Amycolatopsis acididurans TaxID=2724524 RepID=A0ABX1JDS9_9PSEU|nr:STAS domain-containing protein [Amycolatopsis acididurans]NKQ57947.1 STAS domain-containing protein [Amycolatopsis acididurans]
MAYTLHIEPGTAGPVTVRVAGEIDVVNAGEFETEVKAISGPLVLDLGGLDYLDSAGFAALDALLSRRDLTVVIPPASKLRKVASLVGLPHYDDVAAAGAPHRE